MLAPRITGCFKHSQILVVLPPREINPPWHSKILSIINACSAYWLSFGMFELLTLEGIEISIVQVNVAVHVAISSGANNIHTTSMTLD